MWRATSRWIRESGRHRRNFTVLAFESSADDTAVAIVTSDKKILSNVVLKQHAVHKEYGGIHPFMAIAAHQKNMPLAVRKALIDASMEVQDIDGIAFTRGPGIGGCLSVGANAAKSLAAALNKPVIGVHHMQAHALTPLLTADPLSTPSFPFLTLLVSGGHTLLLLASSLTSFRTLATTPDESIGRTFDKVSRMLELPWSNIGPGASLEQFCSADIVSSSQPVETIEVPLVMPGQLVFSFSGVHSFFERYIRARGGLGNIDIATRQALARAFQTAAVSQLEEKVKLGVKLCRQEGVEVKHLIVSGGVASNMFLRERLKFALQDSAPGPPIALAFPPPALCTDNAVMIAWASMHRFLAQDYDPYTIELRSKWKIEDLLT